MNTKVESFLPHELEITLSNHCFLKCKYCFFNYFQSNKTIIANFEKICEGIEQYIKKAKKENVKVERIGFVDYPDPLPYYEILKKLIIYIRKKHTDLKIEVQTNGILLDENKLKFLFDNNVLVVLKFDGTKQSTDFLKKYRNISNSIFDKVIENLKKLPNEYIKKINVAPTFTPDTIHNLVSDINFLSDIGFCEIQLKNMGIPMIWSKNNLKKLEIELKKLKLFYLKTLLKNIKNKKHQLVIHFSSLFNEDIPKTFNEFLLESNGSFYTAYYPFYAKDSINFKVGDHKTGINLNKIKKTKEKIMKYLNSKISNSSDIIYIPNPALLYTTIKLLKVPNSLSLIESTIKFGKIVNKVLYDINKLKKI
jgi:sulfatase maturation enzyme AslB (radical SAM superfamily)